YVGEIPTNSDKASYCPYSHSSNGDDRSNAFSFAVCHGAVSQLSSMGRMRRVNHAFSLILPKTGTMPSISCTPELWQLIDHARAVRIRRHCWDALTKMLMFRSGQ